MRSRRHHEEEHQNHERWLVSYADFITLLFAFFVVMYAVSSVNEGKYRVLSDTLDATFRATERSPNVSNIGSPARSPIPSPNAFQPGSQYGGPDATAELQTALQQPAGTGGDFVDQPKVMAQKVRDSLATLVKKGVVSISEGGDWVEVEMKSQILFDSGNAKLKDVSIPALQQVARSLARFTNRMQVEGYTDNTPISTPTFSSNWELSAARAASVVQLFARSGVNPTRLAAVGYGEFKPKAGNDTPLGRQQNRRVIVRISTREKIDADTRDPGRLQPKPAASPAGTGHTGPSSLPTEVPGEQRPTVNAGAATPVTKPAGQTATQPQPQQATPAPAAEVEWIRTPPEPEGLDLD